ncbi:MAG TPA: ATP-dependent 6-phosphofructokinase [Spirochaetales bacterium]|nr:6-phosphofructokinase [Spirochaetia bacterium]HPE35650.1 ATP-dependent 6-phosphofructokinase [Spirochaetales bacterium]
MGTRVRRFGILTSGGDCPGLNAAIRGVAKAASGRYGMEVVGISRGYRGLIEGEARTLGQDDFSGILTLGGTILGASREKPFKSCDEGSCSDAEAGMDKPERILENMDRLKLDALVVLGGNGTNTTAHLLSQRGVPVIGLPKTIDNDIWGTELSFGFHSAMDIAAESIDRLHSTALSHDRAMVIELMGHKAGWLALHAGVAAGGDVILIPELPYQVSEVAASLEKRRAEGKRFSIVVVAEGALSAEEAALPKKERKRRREAEPYPSIGYRVAAEIEQAIGMEARVTVLGYLQRGGTPSPYDRVLATAFGTAAAELLDAGRFGLMVAMNDGRIGTVSLSVVAGKTRTVPVEHPLLGTARLVGTCLGVPD